MSVNLTAWSFIQESEKVFADYLAPLLPADIYVHPALTTEGIKTPLVAIKNTSVRPYTQQSAIVAHVETTTTITIRTAMDEEMPDAGRENHTALVVAVMGCLMVIDGTTKENALADELNAVGNEIVSFSMAAWASMSSGGDDENRHFVTRIDVDTLINPKAEDE
jgi:hypothetical protein